MSIETRARVRTAAAWLLALVVAAVLLAAADYRTRDPDSRAYITIGRELASRPVDRWIAPEWWGAWGFTGPFREHPAGVFVLPALVTRAGYPAGQAAFAVTLAFQVACLLLLSSLAARLAPEPRARALRLALQLLPIAFVFRIRANQEYALLAGLLLSLLALDRSGRGIAWPAVALAGLLWALLVKGVFALLALPVGAIWLWRVGDGSPKDRRRWFTLAAMAALVPAAAVAYEAAYRSATGLSFLDYYVGSRLALDSQGGTSLPFPLDKAVNALWYLGRVLWYAAPWSLLALAPLLAARGRAAVLQSPWVLGAAAVVLLVALRDTRADRYVFPAYFLIAAGGALAAMDRWPRLAALAERLDRWRPVPEVALWLVLFLARLLPGQRLPWTTFD